MQAGIDLVVLLARMALWVDVDEVEDRDEQEEEAVHSRRLNWEKARGMDN